MCEEWERLVDCATRRASQGLDLQAWLAGVMDAIDSDRVVGIVDALEASSKIPGHRASDDHRSGEVLLPIDPADFLEMRGRLVRAMKEEIAARLATRESSTRDMGALWRRDSAGVLCFTGTAVPVLTLARSLAAGRTIDDFLDRFPSVARWQVEIYLRSVAARAVVPLDLLATLRAHFRDDAQLGVWLTGSNGWLGGGTPLEYLDQPERLFEAARRASEPLAV